MDHNHLLWDDTVAGPKPERIPGKNIMFQHLNNTLNNNYYGGSGSGSGSGSGFSTSAPSILSRSAPPLTVLTVLDPVDVVVPVVTRSITILKTNSSCNYYGSTGGHDSSSLTCTSSISVPSSPVDSSSSLSSSPFSPRTPQFDSKGLLLTRRKNPNPNPMTTTKKKLVHEPRTPTVYDWVVISALESG